MDIDYSCNTHHLSETPTELSKQSWGIGTKPVVSVSCITYNQEKYIREALNSILSQKTTFPVEILVHDDASSDSTPDIIRAYAERYPHIVKPIFQSENQYSKRIRIGATFQYPRVQGKYYALCEGDDAWKDPLKLQLQVSFLEQNLDFVMCFHNAEVLHQSTGNVSLFAELQTREYTGSEILKKWTVPTASVCFRFKELDQNSLLNSNYLYGDIILFLTLAERGRIWCINRVMSMYRRHEQGVSFIKKDLAQIERFIIHHMEIRKNFAGKYWKIQSVILSELLLTYGLKQVATNPSLAMKHIVKAFLTNPKVFIKSLVTKVRAASSRSVKSR